MITFYATQAEARADAAARHLREKVVCFVVRGQKLLVFDHLPDGGAGVQVLAGGLEAGETPEVAASRELREESGLHLSEPQYHCSYLWEAQLPHRFTQQVCHAYAFAAPAESWAISSTTLTGICSPSAGPTWLTLAWPGKWTRRCLTSDKRP